MEMIRTPEYGQLVADIGNLLQAARTQVATTVNNILVRTYWEIGRYIVEYEQNGNERAEYGSNLLNRLASDLKEQYGAGFGRSNIHYMRRLYMAFPKVQTLSELLSWSHYVEILKVDDPLEIGFYVKECEKERWSVRELKRQMSSLLFHRVAVSKDKEGVLKLANEGIDHLSPKDILKDPYVLEFVGLPERGDVQHEDIGQMNLYLNYFRHEVCTEGDNEPIGIVLGSHNNRLTMQYALEGISNQLLCQQISTVSAGQGGSRKRGVQNIG